MKTLTLLFLITFSITTSANYLPESKINGQAIEAGVAVYQKKAKCEAVYSETCHHVPFQYNPEYHELVDEMVGDPASAVYSKNDIEACADQTDCETKNSSKVCTDLMENVYMAQDFSEIYCSKFLRFDAQIPSGKKIIVENATKKAAYDSALAASEAMEAAIATAMKAINHGKRVIALLVVRNASKGLTTAQIEQMNSTYAEIKNLLETGSLVTAKEKIELITPDGTIVTEADKTALISEINSFLGL